MVKLNKAYLELKKTLLNAAFLHFLQSVRIYINSRLVAVLINFTGYLTTQLELFKHFIFYSKSISEHTNAQFT